MFPFRKRTQDSIDDTVILAKEKEVEKKLAEINKSTSKAVKQVDTAVRKVNTAIKKEDIVFNLYYATHSRGKQKWNT